ncbi:MAG: glycogen debranching enzyme, partial [Acidobacteriia bacterium]|nr:glycogen debranching enzyme [Terriglobia bacterium]
DDVRAFFRADDDTTGRIADRFVGSPEIYGHKQRDVEESVNFVSCHDGFTLNDLVSYNEKHNQANGEGNRDGADENRSWNCGIEGPTDDSGVEALRNRQVKNFLTVTMLSLGVPMIGMGDEVRRTQFGNNNAYCQDNETSWFDWALLEKNSGIHRFLRLLIENRLLRDLDAEQRHLSLNQLLSRAQKTWHGVKLGDPDWSPSSHSIALTAHLPKQNQCYHLILNAYWEPLEFELPTGYPGPWRRWVDTALDPPQDIVPWRTAPAVSGLTYLTQPRSVVALYTEASE